MPLDTSPSPDTYNPPASDADPYASPTSYSIANPPPLPSHIDIATLPHGLPIFGPLTGYTNSKLQHIIQSRYVHTSQAISRSLSEKEMTALAYYTAKSHAIASYGPTIGLSLGLYRTWATRKQFNWPFYGSLMSEEAGLGFWDGTALRVGGKEILQGVSTQRKVTMLHALRGATYVSLGMLFVPMVFSSYAATVGAVGEIRDERLHAVTEELRMVANKDLRDRRASMQERRGDPTGQGKRNAGDVWRERREQVTGNPTPKTPSNDTDNDDDMSPTSGAMLDYNSSNSDDHEPARLRNAAEPDNMPQDPQPYTEPHHPQPATRAETYAPPPHDDNDDDDASPTGGRGALDNDDVSAGSVWERIRQQQGSSGGVRQEGARVGEGFPEAEAERGFARDEAQRAFDERVEMERRGGDFGGEGGKGW